jgi:hypothetical protein
MAIGLGALIALLAAGTTAVGTGIGAYNMEAKDYDKSKKDAINLLRSSGSPILQDMDDKSLLALLQEYDISTPSLLDSITGLNANKYTSGLESLFKDVEKLQSFLGSGDATLNRPEELDKDAIDAASKAAFDADYANQLGLVESGERNMLGDIQGTYDTYRKDMLQQQNLNRGQIMNAYQNTFRDQRTRAIEAGASAGLKLANNVNALLSAQNTQRATSLETSNQLANMALQQQNAALQARSQADANRLGLAGRFSETGLKDYQAGQYGTEAGLFDRRTQDYQRNLGNQLGGLGISSSLRNIGLTKAGSSAFSGLNTSNYNRPNLPNNVPTPRSNFATMPNTGGYSSQFNTNAFGNTQNMSDYLRKRNR